MEHCLEVILTYTLCQLSCRALACKMPYDWRLFCFQVLRGMPQEWTTISGSELCGGNGSSAQWAWIWANSGRRWRTGEPGMLQSMGSPRIGRALSTEQQQWFHIAGQDKKCRNVPSIPTLHGWFYRSQGDNLSENCWGSRLIMFSHHSVISCFSLILLARSTGQIIIWTQPWGEEMGTSLS